MIKKEKYIDDTEYNSSNLSKLKNVNISQNNSGIITSYFVHTL